MSPETYLPAHWARSPETAALQEALECELERLQGDTEETLQQLSPRTATWSMADWERAYGIQTEAAKPLELRRSRLISKLRGQGTTTAEMIRGVVSGYTGLNVEVEEHPEGYEVEIRFSGREGTADKLEGLHQSMVDLLPAHILYISAPYMGMGIELTEQVEFQQNILNYCLGSWDLGRTGFASEQDRGVSKMPTTPSIQPQVLEDTAKLVEDSIAAIRINGELVLRDLKKDLEGSTLTVTCTVHLGQVEAITDVELLDGEGEVLTQCAIYVPVTGPTVLRHVIPVREGGCGNG